MADLLDLHRLGLERDGPDGPFTVLRDLDLRVGPGERLALVGGNGSGKSSLLRHLATPGVLPGVRVALVCQDPEEQLVAGTVVEELTLGRPGLDPAPVLARYGLAGRGGEDPRLLSAGQKQRLQLAVMLAGEPDLLLLDEPTSLQDERQGAWLREHLASWPGGLIWATQRPQEVSECSRALALAGGRTLASGTVAEVLADPAVHALLTPAYPQAPPIPTVSGAPIAELRGVACRFAGGGGLVDIDLELRPGDRVGLTGSNGCGKSTLLAVLAGLRRPDAGRVTLGSRPLYRRDGQDLDHGRAALAPQFPEYLFTRANVAAEIRLDPRLAGVDVPQFLASLDLPADLARRHPQDLSGGQKRRLALALALRSGRPLILLDEPTAALDAAGRTRVARLVGKVDTGSAMVVASHDRAFLRACGCRIVDLDAA